MSLIVRCGSIMKNDDVEWPIEEYSDRDPLEFIKENFPDAYLFNFVEGDDCLEWIAEANCDKIKEMIGLRDFDIMNDHKGDYWKTLYINNTKSFDLSGCYSLTSLENCPPNITKLNLFKCTSLISLEHCPKSVISLNLDRCELLISLKYCPKDVIYLDTFGCPSLKSLKHCPINITKLNLSWCTSLTSLEHCPRRVINKLNLRGCISLTSLEYCPPNITKLDLYKCDSLKSLKHRPKGVSLINIPNHLT